MSSADSFLNIVALTAIRDFSYGKVEKQSKNEVFRKVRLSVVIFGALALGMALYLPDIVELFVAGITLNIIFTPITILALVKKDVYRDKKAAFYSILSGTFVIAILFVLGFINQNSGILKIAFVPATIVASLSLIIGICFEKQSHKKLLNKKKQDIQG
jgi:Na+/proline symporter